MEEDTTLEISTSDESVNTSSLRCSITKCYNVNEENTLQCLNCHRYVHYKCTQLPPYQVQMFVNKNKRLTTFTCYNCVTVTKDIADLCKQDAQDIATLKTDISERDEVITKKEESEAKLRRVIEIHKSKYTKLEKKSIHMSTVDHLNKTIQEKIAELGETMKTSILNEMKTSLTKVENQVTDAKKSYANAASSQVPTASGLKTIVKEARYAEIKEKRDHDQRQRNLIIHGVAETNEGAQQDHDQKFVNDLIDTIKIPKPTIKNIIRIGTQSADKNRPIKVILSTEKERTSFLRNLSALKGNEDYKGVSVTEDLTLTERSVLKEWTEKAKDLNLDYSDVIYRVRGDSKNGYYLKKFQKLQRQ